MKYLKKFENNADYEAAESGLILPNVSLIADANKVKYNPIVPDPYGGHAYVEIGGLKWATMNIGAESITDYGKYFQWGDAQGYIASEVGTGSGQKAFTWNDYKYGTSTNLTKYNSTDGKTILEASDDAAQSSWGGNWRMPTLDDIAVLSATTTSAWTSNYKDSGVRGVILKDKATNEELLFLPSGGSAINGEISNNVYGTYWASQVYSNDKEYAQVISISYSYVYWNNFSNRYYGNLIRPVAD